MPMGVDVRNALHTGWDEGGMQILPKSGGRESKSEDKTLWLRGDITLQAHRSGAPWSAAVPAHKLLGRDGGAGCVTSRV